MFRKNVCVVIRLSRKFVFYHVKEQDRLVTGSVDLKCEISFEISDIKFENIQTLRRIIINWFFYILCKRHILMTYLRRYSS
jgi:hypothetical protein